MVPDLALAREGGMVGNLLGWYNGPEVGNKDDYEVDSIEGIKVGIIVGVLDGLPMVLAGFT